MEKMKTQPKNCVFLLVFNSIFAEKKKSEW